MECGLCLALEASFIGEWMRVAPNAFAIVEALHVLGLVTVFGTIAIVDLRLVGLRLTRWSVIAISQNLLRWTWGAFALTVVTGFLLFASAAEQYFENTPFRFKMLALVLAGLNMAVFELMTVRSVEKWHEGASTPRGAKIAGILSLLFWTAAIVFGRWIGFTKGLTFDAADFEGITSQFL